MSTHVEKIAYHAITTLLSTSLILLGIILFIFCKKKPVESEENPSTKNCAHHYSLIDVDAATDGFNHRRIIGKGHLGTVYAAVLTSGQLVAVKRIHSWIVLSHAGLGFSSILKSLSLAHHPHVVPTLGFSEAPGERIIIMEFVGMKSLEFYLHQNSDGASLLDWGRRLRIAAGVAEGVKYLHEVMVPHVVHGCIKPSNILIDVNFRAKVCDYGLYFLAPQELKGLEGYVDDEYWVERMVASKECDVYGFGVVLLELLSGRKSEDGLLVHWALPLIKEMKISEILDPRLVIPFDLKPLVRLAKVALACVGNFRKNRPSIAQVATILTNLNLELCFDSFEK
ncbi:serine/threonine-protein kinase-like protein CR4 [Cornus florida]|uniref:serine/threonine-protein kinase-like protein CR4 n=1 Tax=Cornus florida TaxID=4283 RepID=UPI00289895F3|nr:serine/threonine-protein kinase-like protein CR4 [Cornus florida]